MTFPVIQEYAEGILTVSDIQLCRQMRFFMKRMKMVVEPTSCLVAAAAMNDRLDLRGKKVSVIVSRGNLNVDKIAHDLTLASEN
ncbi:pyridoxal-phosphate dependent enzyme [Serratia ureilytica]|uniref:pyridoxal-phosphate dependent enzyme n=1 Tax=Serratia ureilytica TaxID=300181 RepID=UPI002B1CB1B1|nr:pyridoxal-phosphate dependent enzyme [Serratia ureilytica]